jgi:hypothetical protein
MNAVKMLIYNNSDKHKLNRLKCTKLTEKTHEYSDNDSQPFIN